MLTILFLILLFGVFGKILFFALKACWGITRILVSVLLLPLVIIGIAVAGFTYLAIGLLVIIGIVSLAQHL